MKLFIAVIAYLLIGLGVTALYAYLGPPEKNKEADDVGFWMSIFFLWPLSLPFLAMVGTVEAAAEAGRRRDKRNAKREAETAEREREIDQIIKENAL